MSYKTILSAAVLSLASVAANAAGVTGITGGGGVSGISGISGGIGSDFFASNVPGANMESTGGLAMALESAFSGGEKEKKKKK